jgi:hypothetical protein
MNTACTIWVKATVRIVKWIRVAWTQIAPNSAASPVVPGDGRSGRVHRGSDTRVSPEARKHGTLQVVTGPLSDRIGRKGLIDGGMLVQAGGIWLTVLVPTYPA